MRAMIFEKPGQPLRAVDIPKPRPGAGEVLVQVRACAVCRTDLHVVDGELPNQNCRWFLDTKSLVSSSKKAGASSVSKSATAWAFRGWAGHAVNANFAAAGAKISVTAPRFTGYTLDGGYAEFTVADERFCFPIPENYSDAEAAPLLCAGLIGYRSLQQNRRRKTSRHLWLWRGGAHRRAGGKISRPRNFRLHAARRFGGADNSPNRSGAVWAGDSETSPPEQLGCGDHLCAGRPLVPLALKAVAKGGTVVCGGIHMSDIPSFPYDLLWQERTLCSVANLTRRDGEEFFALAPRVPVRTTVRTFPLAEANEALARLRHGKLQGAAVLMP